MVVAVLEHLGLTQEVKTLVECTELLEGLSQHSLRELSVHLKAVQGVLSALAEELYPTVVVAFRPRSQAKHSQDYLFSRQSLRPEPVACLGGGRLLNSVDLEVQAALAVVLLNAESLEFRKIAQHFQLVIELKTPLFSLHLVKLFPMAEQGTKLGVLVYTKPCRLLRPT